MASHPEDLLPEHPPAHPDRPAPFCLKFLLFLSVSEKRSDNPSFFSLLPFPDPDTVSADLLFSLSAANV